MVDFFRTLSRMAVQRNRDRQQAEKRGESSFEMTGTAC